MNEQCAVLAIYESSIHIEDAMRQRMMQAVQNEDQYQDIVTILQDPEQTNEVKRNERSYRIKRGLLRMHETNQPDQYDYWRVIVPNQQEIKLELLKELHCVPYASHPGFTRTLEITRRYFYWDHLIQEVREFVLDCPVCQVEKGSHLKPAGKLLPLEVPVRK